LSGGLIDLCEVPVIDLRSDTLSMPTDEMLRAIQAAPLGDDSRDGDPTVLELEALAADMLGKEAAVLTVSGTMSNLIALRTHAQPGATAVVEESAHLYGMEFGGIAAACSLLVMPVRGQRGSMDLDALHVACHRSKAGFPARGVVCLENTHNAAGGTVIPLAHMDACTFVAREHQLPVHLDGARIFNAAVALGVSPRKVVRQADSVSFCLSKGLSAPVGSLLCGSREFVDRARRIRRALGGTMRQAGIIAAPGLVALRTMVARLEEDHANARSLGEALASMPELGVDLASVQSNMVNVDVSGLGIDAAAFAHYLETAGVRGLPAMGSIIRFVTYRGITREHIQQAIASVCDVLAARPWRGAPVTA
jgi:threonine aldolase